jgi:hypothetical protein
MDPFFEWMEDEFAAAVGVSMELLVWAWIQRRMGVGLLFPPIELIVDCE